MPPVPIVDTHVHLWDPQVIWVPWLDHNPHLNQLYGPAEYRVHTAGVDIEAMVYLQVDAAPAYGLLEARWVADRAQEEPRLQAIVAWAPVECGERVRTYLDALTAIDPRVKGVRWLIQAEADPQFCLRPDFVRGVQILGEYSLSFDLGVHRQQLAAAAELVRRCPEVQFMLDHLAKPNIRDHQRDPWWDDLSRLAEAPNVMCKLSGLTTAADPQHWTVDDLAPYVDHALAVFGPDRVAYGSDWPVMLAGASYPRWVEALETLTANRPLEEQRKLWAENGRRFYRLPEPVDRPA